MKKNLIASVIFLTPLSAFADLTVEPYGSIRAQAEYVSVDEAKAGEKDSYTGVRDAYSRFGVKADYTLSNQTKLGAKIEIPFNIQRMRAEDPSFFEGFYKDNNSPRIYKLTASGNWGSVAMGKQWLAYYNAVAYPVDYFSSFYSGFATHATFRREALTYTTPNFSGFNVTASMVDMVDGGDEAYLDTNQYALSYANGGVTLALAYQDSIDGTANILGASAALTSGPWRFATKVEQLDSPTGTTNADPFLYNLYASYNHKNYTYKAHYAKGDKSSDGSAFFQGASYHLGVDYQYTKNLKVFVEYFYEDSGYAIYTPDTESFDVLAGYQANTDGSAFAIGARYDF